MVEKGVVKLDPYLSPFKDALKRRFSKTQNWIKKLQETEGGLDKFSKVGSSRLPFRVWLLI
jgi:1,4-alpha-glucan branching enzyme